MAMRPGMRIAVSGGGPAGLYFAILMKRSQPAHEITVWERNAPDDAFGFGVVFSDETLTVFEHADPESYAAITEQFARWTDIDIHLRGQVITSGGHGFAALGRRALLGILQRRALELGVTIHFNAETPPYEELASHDLVLAADGLNSALRHRFAETFRPSLDPRRCRYMWLGTDLVFDSFKFFVKETEHGIVQVHGYPYDATMSTFIVEAGERFWQGAGLDAIATEGLGPGESDEASIAFCAELFADELGGHAVVSNNSKWLRFTTVRNERWRHENVVLIGDAAHTAHFSIGSGTKLAMEDAVALAWAFHENGDDLDAAVAAYEAERRPIVESTQRAAQASLEWFEGIDRYAGQDALQLAFNLLTRSRRITHAELTLRDAPFVRRVEEEALDARVGGHEVDGRMPPPMFTPLRLRDVELANRVVVSPMDMYSAVDGVPGDFHLVHLGSRGQGGAGLVMTEMVCVSARGRITPGCTGLYAPEHLPAWRRIVDYVHAHGGARFGCQIGHSGRKGSTKRMWEGIDQPLEDGNWPLIAPSPLPYYAHSQVPREMTRADMDEVRDQFVASARMAAEAGFDLLEVHAGHGYLLSSFLSPLTNRRTDEYGGSLENRARFVLEVFDACRAVWPEHLPMSMRISATDWAPGGFDGDDAVAFARMLKQHGCDLVDVSTGQVVHDQRPALGRSFQTPFADRIRNEVGIPVIAVGAISSYDDVNTIILAGRADLCALGRPHLYDPHWTLHAAAEQEWPHVAWISPYQAGRRRPVTGKDAAAKPAPRTFAGPAAEPQPTLSRPPIEA
ncbi:MAG TPA: bifunctional salicylyl-CoA 5-hydroxylase/oxidoreductase [Solirubrobacteraceae bacterium]|nr:bifunctional salicylyl-CoA 5-hydroxylase/oxidoreductase [Solirubrobacteraceae bacterium]